LKKCAKGPFYMTPSHQIIEISIWEPNAWVGIGKELKIKRKVYVSSRDVRIVCPRLKAFGVADVWRPTCLLALQQNLITSFQCYCTQINRIASVATLTRSVPLNTYTNYFPNNRFWTQYDNYSLASLHNSVIDAFVKGISHGNVSLTQAEVGQPNPRLQCECWPRQ
jgi:hypothetical protein